MDSLAAIGIAKPLLCYVNKRIISIDCNQIGFAIYPDTFGFQQFESEQINTKRVR